MCHFLVMQLLLWQVTYAVCSGSEANDLSFRIACAVRARHAGRFSMCVKTLSGV